MYELISSVASGTVPTPVAAAVGLFGLGAGLIWMRAAAADKLAKAREFMAVSVRYGVRGDSALARMRAVDTPTQQVDVSELRAAHATILERLHAWSRDKDAQVREAITPMQAEPDWAEGEMTAAFRKIVDGNEWEQPGTFTDHTLPGNASPWVSPLTAGPAPAPSAPPAIVIAPRGPQTPPRWVDGGTPPPQRRAQPALTPRDRAWTLLGKVPPLSLPDFPQPFRMPTQRRRPTPALLAKLPADPTREFRVRTVEA